MLKFALNEIKEIQGKIKVFKLSINGKCEFDEFEELIKKEGNLNTELYTIQARLQEMSDLKSLPFTKFKDITPKKELNKEYEIKTANLRVYLFHDKTSGRIIVCAGKKGTQPKDIKHFRKIKKEYFNK